MFDLETVTTDELVEELLKRHDALVVVGRPKVNKDFAWSIWTTGPVHENLGLCCLAQGSLQKQALSDTNIENRDFT